MKPKHVFAFAALASLVLVSGCSGDDDEGGDVCLDACLKLESCGQGLVCNGLKLEPEPCAERCRAGNPSATDECFRELGDSCDADALAICSGGIRC